MHKYKKAETINMRRIKHAKVRNTGLLFEFLIRQTTADILDKNDNNNAIKIIKEKFSSNTELGKELSLYNCLNNKKFKNDKKAGYFINEVLSERQKLNNTLLKREKYNLIKEIKENYDLQKFMSSKVRNYKLYASIYKLFEYVDLSPEDKTISYFNIMEHVTTNSESIKLSETAKHLPEDEDLRILTYKTLLEKFNQKYTKLSGAQKNLLREYINNVSNTNSLKDTLKEIVKELKQDLKKHSKNLKDEVVKIKMTEAIKSINKLCGINDKSDVVKDSYVVQTMRYLELLKELKKSGNKKQKVI